MKLEQLVLERGLVAPETLARARLVQAETGERLDSVLTRLGMIAEQTLAGALAKETGLPLAGTSDFPAEPVLPEAVSVRFLRDVKAVPIAANDDSVDVALIDPLDPYPLEALTFALGRRVRPLVAKANDVEAALDRLYGSTSQVQDGEETVDESDVERLKDLASDAPVVRTVNNLITRASEARASDIHIEPAEDCVRVRYRVDGALVDVEQLPAQMKLPLVSRIKVMASLDIAERRLPQDGRLRVAVRGHEIDLRIATSPTIHGESVVMRILDRSSLSLDFQTLGFADDVLEKFLHALKQPHGIVLVTGPTGSGKTTTLYASLAAINSPDRKILTIEDPIEYRLAGINQTQVKPQIGLTFAAALRSFLRQDPDVMMVGEIRDLETAEVAIQSALTGHTILSTLHTNTAAASVTRLLDMRVEPFLITSTLNAVLAQRLVRRLCPKCREPYEPAPGFLKSLLPGSDVDHVKTLYRPRGCDACGHTGFRGRLCVTELLPVNDQIAQLVISRAEAREIQRVAVADGMRTMLADGLMKSQAGLTTIEEVLRATREV
ncbi:MAG: Flp pilus assembly complex ATPase component TadA [Alphaproteobacteria bacterium]|nr:Flp pilus assembly complex ATPase component TadA [Alphaproteobacteria bacterium]